MKCTWKRRLRNNIHFVSANVLNTILRILAQFRFFLGLDIWVHSEQLLLSMIVYLTSGDVSMKDIVLVWHIQCRQNDGTCMVDLYDAAVPFID